MSDPGPDLARWLDQLRGGESMRAWATRHGLDDARISAWRTGGEPSIAQMRAIADALGRPLADVLIAAGIGTHADFGRGELPDVDDAIERDPRLTEGERGALRLARYVAAELASGRRPHGGNVPIPPK